MINLLTNIFSPDVNNNVIIPFTLSMRNMQTEPLHIEIPTMIVDGVFEDKFNIIHVFKIDNELGEIPVTSLIEPEDFDKIFILKFNKTEVNAKSIYIRVFNEKESRISEMVHISTDNTMEFLTTPFVLNFKPKLIKISDTVKVVFNKVISELSLDNFDINISVSNNANNSTPVWEDMTFEYLNNLPYTIRNNIKETDKKWCISVKYTIKKKNPDSTIEISNIRLMVI